jgi:hypothetical protein
MANSEKGTMWQMARRRSEGVIVVGSLSIGPLRRGSGNAWSGAVANVDSELSHRVDAGPFAGKYRHRE